MNLRDQRLIPGTDRHQMKMRAAPELRRARRIRPVGNWPNAFNFVQASLRRNQSPAIAIVGDTVGVLLLHVDVPEIEHHSRQRLLCVVSPNAAGKHKSSPRLTRQTELASERRASPVERPVGLRSYFAQFTFWSDFLL